MRRLVVLLVVALGIAPGTWVRSPAPQNDTRQILTVTGLELPAIALGPLELTGAWELDSPNRRFGSYSGLVALDGATLLAASDYGTMLLFPMPGEQGRPRIASFPGTDARPTYQRDLEALTRDATGRIWGAYEMMNRIERYDAELSTVDVASPQAMRDWPSNAGPEGMVRLADGRFIVLAEGPLRWFGDETQGLLFPADPVDGAAPLPFRFVAGEGFRPVDMAQLPDGRVLILLRKVAWGLPPGFAGKLVVADPATIREGAPWHAQPVAILAEPLPSENYEGIAVESDGRGGSVVWLISDDNNSNLQRTLLLRLAWRANEKARDNGRAPE